MESSKETGYQAPEGPILCIKNCGFFGSAATMNMCSKCHKDMITQQEQAKLAASSIENIVNGGGSCSSTEKDPMAANAAVQPGPEEVNVVLTPTPLSHLDQLPGVQFKEGPNRCSTCRKRVGLTGFSCRCGNLFCASHRYSEKHDCPYDYQTAGRDAIAKANPVVRAEKLDKI